MEGLNLRQLKVFRIVARQESFAKAADALYITQPAVSAHIRGLEQFLGLKLFEPAGRGVKLTGAGHVVLEASEEVFRGLEAFERGLADYRGLERGELTIGASTTPGTYLLPSYLGEFHRRYPGIRLALRIGDTGDVHRWVADGSIHLGVVGSKVEEGRVVSEHWKEDHIILVTPPDHPFTRERRIPLERLAEERLLLREAGSGTRQVIERSLPFKPLPSLELGSTEAIKQAVAAGLGITLLSEDVIQNEVLLKQMVVVEVEGLPIIRSFYIVRRSGERPTLAEDTLLNLLRRGW